MIVKNTGTCTFSAKASITTVRTARRFAPHTGACMSSSWLWGWRKPPHPIQPAHLCPLAGGLFAVPNRVRVLTRGCSEVVVQSSSHYNDRMNKWSYSLTVEEEATCARIGYQRQAPMLAQPERNVNYSEGDVWEVMQHMVCAGSELAFARMMGFDEFSPHVNKFKSALDVPGYGEVRYAFPRGWPSAGGEVRGLRMTTRDDDSQKYALMVGGLATKTRRTGPDWLGAPYVCIGWMYGHEAKRDEWKFNDKTWYAPVSALRSMV